MLKKAAAESLASYMRANLSPALGIDIGVLAAQWEEPTTFPSIRILPGRFIYMPAQENELDDSLALLDVFEVGCFDGTMQIRVSAKSTVERDRVEDAVTNLFLARELAPGIIVTRTPDVTVGGIATAYSAIVSFAVEDAEFHDEMVFTKKRYTFMDVNAWYPALVARNVNAIQEMVSAFTDDLSSDVAQEEVLVADDGSISKTNI